MQSIELNIDELVLHGFSPGDRYRIGSAVEQELTRLFSEQGVPPSLSSADDVPTLQADAFQMSPVTGADAIGSRIAHTVYTGFKSGK